MCQHVPAKRWERAARWKAALQPLPDVSPPGPRKPSRAERRPCQCLEPRKPAEGMEVSERKGTKAEYAKAL